MGQQRGVAARVWCDGVEHAITVWSMQQSRPRVVRVLAQGRVVVNPMAQRRVVRVRLM